MQYPKNTFLHYLSTGVANLGRDVDLNQIARSIVIHERSLDRSMTHHEKTEVMDFLHKSFPKIAKILLAPYFELFSYRNALQELKHPLRSSSPSEKSR